MKLIERHGTEKEMRRGLRERGSLNEKEKE